LKALCIVKPVLEKLIQEIKELYLIQVCEELLIKEPFVKQSKLCLMNENYLYSISVKD